MKAHPERLLRKIGLVEHKVAFLKSIPTDGLLEHQRRKYNRDLRRAESRLKWLIQIRDKYHVAQ